MLIGTLANDGATELIAHYEFEGNFDDSSGNGLHGTPVGNSITVLDEVRNTIVLELDGDDDIVELDRGLFIEKELDLFDEITVAVWVNTSQGVSGIQFSGGLNTDWALGGVHIKLNNGLVNVGINGAAPDVVGTTVIPVGEWHQLHSPLHWQRLPYIL